MAIKNDMELLVRAELEKRRERSGRVQEHDVCWCALCEVDMLALALNQLPTRYCHERNFGCAALQGFGEHVRTAVARAILKVSRRPKHRPGRPLSRGDDISVENYAQKIGGTLVRGVLAAASSACACDQCQADTLALALNRYTPKYGVSYGGRRSYQDHYTDFIRHEVGQALTLAAVVVRQRPHH